MNKSKIIKKISSYIVTILISVNLAIAINLINLTILDNNGQINIVININNFI